MALILIERIFQKYFLFVGRVPHCLMEEWSAMVSQDLVLCALIGLASKYIDLTSQTIENLQHKISEPPDPCLRLFFCPLGLHQHWVSLLCN